MQNESGYDFERKAVLINTDSPISCQECQIPFNLGEEENAYPHCAPDGRTKCSKCMKKHENISRERKVVKHSLFNALLDSCRKLEAKENPSSWFDQHPVIKQGLTQFGIIVIVGLLIAVWAALSHLREATITTQTLRDIMHLASDQSKSYFS